MNTLRRYFSVELFFWIIALAYLALLDPGREHFSFCLLKHAGFTYCPGCGLGRSVSYLLHGNIPGSLHTHLLGIATLPLIFYRILQLFQNNHQPSNNKNYGKSIHNL